MTAPVLTPDDRKLLEQTAERIVRARMAVPAMMMLEMVQPMNFVSSAMLRVVSPSWRAVVGESRVEQLASILERRETIPEFISMIDAQEDAHRREKRAAKQGSAPKPPASPAPPISRTPS